MPGEAITESSRCSLLRSCRVEKAQRSWNACFLNIFVSTKKISVEYTPATAKNPLNTKESSKEGNEDAKP